MRFILLLLLCFTTFGYSQNSKLVKLVDSDKTLEQKQKLLDFLVLDTEKKIPFSIELADFYHDMGSKWYYQNWVNGENDEYLMNAILYTKKAATIKREKVDELEGESLGQTLYNLGYFYFKKEDFFQSEVINLELSSLGKNDVFYLDANHRLGLIYLNFGDFYKAIERFSVVAKIYKEDQSLDDNGLLDYADVNLLIAETYAEIGYKENSSRIENLLMTTDSILNKVDDVPKMYENSILQMQGDLLSEKEKYLGSISKYKKALVFSEETDSLNQAILYNSLHVPQIELLQYDTAKKSLDRAILLAPYHSDSYENLGDVYVAKKDFEKGLYNYQKAISIAANNEKDIQYDAIPTIQDLEVATEKVYLLNHIITKANGWLKYYKYDSNKSHLNNALETFEVADKLVDIIRSESTEYQSKLFWREKGASLYTKAVEVCYLLNKPEDAYYFMERNKAILLLEDIGNEQAKEISKLPGEIAQREFNLKQAILFAENDLQSVDSNAPETVSDLQQEVYVNKLTYNTFMDSLNIAFPQYAQLKKKVDILSHTNFKANYVSEDEVVLQYILNEEQGYGLLSAADKTHFFKLENVLELNEKIVNLYGELTQMVSDEEKVRRYATISNEVFKALVPIEVYNAIKGKKLTLIADYTLQQIPFESFVVDKNEGTYFIEEVEVRYAYSMSYLYAKKQVEIHPQKGLLAIAPIGFETLGLPKLFSSGSEVNEIAQFFDGSSYSNTDATKANLLDNIYDHSVVHLSTHADVSETGNHWIAFSDEKMFVNEVYATKNQAKMVVLSACNTSVGKLKKGEGAMSLARGFFHSGAKSVVSSLWTANDKISKDIMVDFYKGLDKGMTKSAAMKRAKLNCIDKYRGSTITPSYWATLIVIGDNAPITSSSFSERNWIWLTIGALILLSWVFWQQRKKK